MATKRAWLPRWAKRGLATLAFLGALSGAAYVFRDELLPVPACVDADVLRLAEQLLKERLPASNGRVVDGRERRFDPLAETRHCTGHTAIGARYPAVDYTVQWENRLRGMFSVSVSSSEGFAASVEQGVKSDAIDQYNTVRYRGSLIDRCAQAGLVAAAHLQANDRAGYERWKRTEEADCRAAGAR